MNSVPLVSIIIPAYNAQTTLTSTLESVLAQTYDNIEIIVVDDGSTDGTAGIVRQYGERVRYYFQENSGGCARARNTGMGHASGDYISFIDADDLMVYDRIQKQIEFMQLHNDIDMVFCNYRNFGSRSMFDETHFHSCPILWQRIKDREAIVMDDACAVLARENFGIMGTVLIRSKCLREVTGFETRLKACEDFHFYYRIARNARVGVLKHVGLLRRLHDHNMSSNVLKMLLEGIHSRTLLYRSEPDPLNRRYLSDYIATCLNSLSRLHAEHGRYALALKCNYKVISGPYAISKQLDATWNMFRTSIMLLGLYQFPSKLSALNHGASKRQHHRAKPKSGAHR